MKIFNQKKFSPKKNCSPKKNFQQKKNFKKKIFTKKKLQKKNFHQKKIFRILIFEKKMEKILKKIFPNFLFLKKKSVKSRLIHQSKDRKIPH